MKIFFKKWGKTIGIFVFLIIAFVAGNTTGVVKSNQIQTKVLGVSTHITPTPTPSSVPTAVPVTIINNIILPTQAPTPTPGTVQNPASPTPTPQIIIATPTPTPIISPTPPPTSEQATPSPTITPTPTSIPQTTSVVIDYAGEHEESHYTATITPNETAWQAVEDAVGISNIQQTDYGGSLGIFITGFNGVNASANQYYDFQVNGTSSNVGVSSYVLQNGDTLKFVLTGF